MKIRSTKQHEVLAIIPARGGSKGVPRKNLRLLLGKPLLVWAIERARDAKSVTRVIVSTDDEEIADLARAHGAEVPFLRPAEISQDLSTDVEFLLHALSWLKENESYEPEAVVTVRATAPLCPPARIDEGVRLLLDTPEADAARPITEAPKHPYKMWKISADGKWLEPFLTEEFTGLSEPHNSPRQLFPKIYVHTGSMDVMRPRTIRELRSTSGKKLLHFYMPPEESVNIDTDVDFKLAETLLRQRFDKGENKA